MQVGDLVRYKLNDPQLRIGVLVRENDTRQRTFDVLDNEGKIHKIWVKYLEVINESR